MLDITRLEAMSREFHQIAFREKRTGLFKVIVPFFHEDGDMYDMFIEECPGNNTLLRISDYGLTLMRLSYSFDIDTPKREEVLLSIISQNRCRYDTGLVYLDIAPSQFSMGIYQFAQVITKISSMEVMGHDVAQSMFFTNLNECMAQSFQQFHYDKDYTPTDDNQLTVDYRIPPIHEGAKSLFVYGVSENTKAAKVIICCLAFQQNKIPFRSLIIHEDFDGLSRFNRNQITNAADKQFVSLDDFHEKGVEYITREFA